MGCGENRVARVGSGAKAPPLAARLNPGWERKVKEDILIGMVHPRECTGSPMGL